MELAIKGKTALVTGASMGIGRGIATALAREGVKLAVVARRRSLLEELEKELGQKLVIIECDLMQENSFEKIAQAALDGLGSVEILINNAGGSRKFTLESNDDQWEEALTLNFTRQRQLAHKLLPQMMAKKWGRIVNITGKSEPEGLNGAFAAKAAMHSWAKGLSREVGKHGITINSIPPGRIMSEQISRHYTPEYRQWQADNEIPVGRYGEPADIGHLVCFLASPLAGYISGAVIPVDGGHDVPEITTRCWAILDKRPGDMMCATSRMIVKRQGAERPSVVPCTLIPYDAAFEMGATLADAAHAHGGMFAAGAVKLCHPHCAKFCVLGGGSCSGR